MRKRMDQLIQTTKEKEKVPHEIMSCNRSSTFCLYLEPFLNTYYQTYQNIITLNTMPEGPLGKMVTLMNTPKLSPYQVLDPNQIFNCNCKYVLPRYPTGIYKNAYAFLGSEDIPMVLGFLISSGYTIETSLTEMLFQSRVVSNQKIICMVTYNNNK